MDEQIYVQVLQKYPIYKQVCGIHVLSIVLTNPTYGDCFDNCQI